MTEITSEELSINRPSKRVYDFLNDLRNYENLMPSDDMHYIEIYNAGGDVDLTGWVVSHLNGG